MSNDDHIEGTGEFRVWGRQDLPAVRCFKRRMVAVVEAILDGSVAKRSIYYSAAGPKLGG